YTVTGTAAPPKTVSTLGAASTVQSTTTTKTATTATQAPAPVTGSTSTGSLSRAAGVGPSQPSVGLARQMFLRAIDWLMARRQAITAAQSPAGEHDQT